MYKERKSRKKSGLFKKNDTIVTKLLQAFSFL
jgi:hypothetical protein